MSGTFAKFGKDLGCDITIQNGEVRRVSLFAPEHFKRQSIMSLQVRNGTRTKALNRTETANSPKLTCSKPVLYVEPWNMWRCTTLEISRV